MNAGMRRSPTKSLCFLQGLGLGDPLEVGDPLAVETGGRSMGNQLEMMELQKLYKTIAVARLSHDAEIVLLYWFFFFCNS